MGEEIARISGSIVSDQIQSAHRRVIEHPRRRSNGSNISINRKGGGGHHSERSWIS